MKPEIVKEWRKSLPENIEEIILGRILADSVKWIQDSSHLSEEQKKEELFKLKKWGEEESKKLKKKKNVKKEGFNL